jgi:hypothetical protein
MKTTVNFNQFCDGFRDMNRNENFSYEGKRALFDYMEELEEDTGEEIEFDVIALCCDYTEYADLAEFQADYDDSYDSIEDIENATTVIRINDDAFIIQQF